MKKMLTTFICVLSLISLFSSASAIQVDQTTEYLEDGSYLVIEIEDTSPGISLLSSSATKSKKLTYYTATGEAQWYVRVTGTFTYGDGSAKCTSASVSAGSYSSNWRIASKSSSKSGNRATATAVAEQLVQGQALNSVTKSITLTCSSTGKFS